MRLGELNENGVVTIVDMLNITADQETQISDLFLGFNRFYSDFSHNFTILKDDIELVPFVEEVNEENLTGYRIHFTSPITIDEGEKMEIKASYNFINLSNWLGGNYSLVLPVYPVLDKVIDSASFEFKLPEGANLTTVQSSLEFDNSSTEEGWLISHSTEMIQPYTRQDVILAYTPNEGFYIASFELLERGINVKSGRLSMIDKFRVLNMGERLPELRIPLADGAENLEAMDGAGPLEVVLNSSGTGSFAAIKPRLPLSTGSLWKFTLSYEADRDPYVERDGNQQTFQYTDPGFPYPIKNYMVRVMLPRDSDYNISDEWNTSVIDRDSKTHIVYTLGKVLPKDETTITLNFSMSFTPPLTVPLIIIVIIAIIIGVVYYFRVRRDRVTEMEPVEEGREVQVDRSDLEEFTNLYNKRLSLLRELENLDRDLASGRIEADEYTQRTTEIQREVQRLLRSLRQKEETLLENNPELNETLSSVDRMESNLTKLENDLRNLENRYRAGRIPRRDYYRRRESLSERRGEIADRIDKRLNEIK
jgi:hypothetical protein